jgi:hypothetical protein
MGCPLSMHAHTVWIKPVDGDRRLKETVATMHPTNRARSLIHEAAEAVAGTPARAIATIAVISLAVLVTR